MIGTLAVPAIAADWEELVDTPHPVEPGAGIVYAAGSIWAILPYPDEEEPDAYLWRYDCGANEWDAEPTESLWGLFENSAITWQPGIYGSGVIWIIGVYDGEDPMLYWYDIDEEDFDEEDVDDMFFGSGAALAHGNAWQPPWVKEIQCNVGWLYCLEGGSNEFWRYGIPFEYDPPEEDSIHPPDSSALADPTPTFKWSAPDSTYRLLVATDENFSNVVIDQITSTSNYEPSTALDDGQYFWKVGTSDGLGGYDWSVVHAFWLYLEWVRLEDLPASATEGAALAFDYKNYYLMETAPIAFRGGTNVKEYYIYDFDEEASQWTDDGMHETPKYQKYGTALATPQYDADYMQPFAVFGQVEPRYAYRHHDHFGWQDYGNELLETPYGGAALAYAHYNDRDYLYMIHGNSSTTFGRLRILPEEGGGGKSRTVSPLVPRARILSQAGEQALQYTLDAQGPVRVTLCDVTGRVAATLQSGFQPAGEHELRWNPRTLGLRAGAYVVALDAGARHERFKVIVR